MIVGKYSLNGNANDSAGSNNGVSTNVTWVDGKMNGAGSFNGVSSVITATGDTGTGNRSIETIVNISTQNRNTMIYSEGALSNNNSWGIYIGDDNNIRGFIYGAPTEIISIIKTGVHYLCLTYNGSLISLYIDSILIGTITTSLLNVSITNIGIGRWSNFAGYYFNGKIDEVIRHNTQLAQTEIKNKHLYYNGFI